MLSKFFIDHPIFATVITILIVLMGALSIPLLPVEKTPDIIPPTVIVNAYYPGANAEVVAKTVATPLEEAINGVDDMLYMSSSSGDDGSLTLTVTFKVGTDIDMATVLVQNRVSVAEAVLPEEVKRNGISTQKSSNNITMAISLISPDGQYDETYMSNYITIYLSDVLTRIEGVGNIEIFGAKDFGMRIWIDPQLLKSRNLTTVDVINAIREQNIQVAAGQIGAPPTNGENQFQYTVKTLGRLDSVEQFENIIIKTQDQSKTVKLKDIARIELGSELYGWYAQHNSKNSIVMGVFQRPGANALNIANDVRAQMKNLSKSFPEGLEYRIAFDPTLFISESIKEVVKTLLFAVVLVVLSVFIFLGNVRTTIIPAITIPVSLIGTFTVMLLLGMSINTLTLFGLVLAIGIVVDDAIVVVEGTMRIIQEEQLFPKNAAVKAMKQLTGPVIATTLVLLSVFIPTILIGGVSGRLYTQFAITISVATVFSSINALTLSPALCALFLRPSDQQKENWFSRFFNKFMAKATNRYINAVKITTRKISVCMLVYIILLALTFLGISNTPTEFLPIEDEGFIFLDVELPEGASLARTKEVTDRINSIIEETPGIYEYVTIGGFSIVKNAVASNVAFYFISLDTWSQRRSKELSSESIAGMLNGKIAAISEAKCFALAPPPIFGLGFTDFELQLQDKGDIGLDQLQQASDVIQFSAMSNSNIMFVLTTLKTNYPQLFVDIDREKVKSLLIPLDSVFNTLQACLGSFYVNDFTLFGRTYKVLVQGDAQHRLNTNDIGKLQVRNQMGKMVPFDTFANVEDSSGPQTVYHYNMYPSNSVQGKAMPGVSSGQAMEEMEKLLAVLPSGIEYEWSGISYQEIEAGNKAPIIFLLASVFVFLFLAAQYESWIIPVAIILTVPLALFGAMLLTATRMFNNNIYTQIGFILLIGLASKTSILLVEFAKQLHEEGKSPIDAAIEAARIRFRPILMTALSFVFGVLPLVLATGAGAVSRQSMGTAVFGGMLMATILGIFLIPVFYVMVQKLGDKFKYLK